MVTLTVISFRVPADLRAPVYHYGVVTGGEKEWDFAYSQFTNTDVVSDKRLLLHAMAGAQEPWLIERFLTSFIKFLTKRGLFLRFQVPSICLWRVEKKRMLSVFFFCKFKEK